MKKTAADQNPFCDVEEAIRDISHGRMVIVVDDVDRENEGDLTLAAEKVTPKAINFMARYGRGLICVPMTPPRLQQLEIPQMVENNTSTHGTAFCISVEARHGVTTGISAEDRSTTVQALMDPLTRPEDLVRPGHIFPLLAKPEGVLQRPGQTEAAVDLARLAGLRPAGVICEVMNPDGTMARIPQLRQFARRHRLKMIAIADLIQYRMRHEKLIERIAQPKLPTTTGNWRLIAYRSRIEQKIHMALVMGDPRAGTPCTVRLHSECMTGDVFGSIRCDCGKQLLKAMEIISGHGSGILIYLRQEGRGIGLVNKLRAYEIQDRGKDTVEANHSLGFRADQRNYGIGAQILQDLGVDQIRVLSNNPKKFIALQRFGIKITERIPLEIQPDQATIPYLRAKKQKLGHLLSVV
ncbi:MAG: bifunctional 3,4-dihydroxy-2-butanone-4-phosphate synthase/GTP cyclohydrolase II [Acidobacteriota bacterium]